MPTYWRVKPPILGQTQSQVDGILIIFPSFSYNFPILFPSFSHHFSHHIPILFSHPLPIIFPSFLFLFPILFPILFPSFSHHFFPLKSPWKKNPEPRTPRVPQGFRSPPGVVTLAVYAYLRRGLLDAAARAAGDVLHPGGHGLPYVTMGPGLVNSHSHGKSPLFMIEMNYTWGKHTKNDGEITSNQRFSWEKSLFRLGHVQ